MTEKICGTCGWHSPGKLFTDTDEWYCAIPCSDYYSDWTDYNHTCDYWEERE